MTAIENKGGLKPNVKREVIRYGNFYICIRNQRIQFFSLNLYSLRKICTYSIR